ncbi:MAG: PAS domain S-box protein, partial [Maribacter sp.]
MIPPHLTDLLLDQSKHAIWMVNRDFQLVYINKACQLLIKEVAGVEKKIHESALLEVLGKEHMERWKGYFTKAFKGEYFEVEQHYFNSNLNEIQFRQIVFEPVVGENQNIVAVACRSQDITRLVKQKSEASQLLDASLDVFCTFNTKGEFVYVSASASQHWGYTLDELLGKPFIDFVLEADVTRTNKVLRDIYEGEKIKSFFNRYLKKDGSIAYNLWSSTWDEESELTYAVARDGKDTMDQQEKLVRSEQRFKALVQGANDLYAIIDLEGRYTYMSPSSTAIIGIPPEAFIGMDAFEFIHPDDIEQTQSSLKKIATEGKVVMERYRAKNQYGEWRWVETVLTNMLDNPAVNGIVINSRDITEKIEQENKILLSQKRFEALVENSMDCVIIISPEGNTTYASKSIENILGYSPKEVMDMNFTELVHPEDLSKAESALLRCISEPGVPMKGHTSRVKHKNGSWRWIEPVITNLLHDPSIMGIVDNFRDITDERNLRELKREVGKLAKIGSWEFDAVNDTIFWSDEVHQIYGTDPSSFVPNVDAAINYYREDYRDLALSSFERCIQTKEPYSIEAVIVNTDNKEVWVRTTAKADFVDDVCTRVYGSFQDISEIKETENRLLSLSENLPGVVYQYLINTNGTDQLRYVSKGAEKLWGFTAKEVMDNMSLAWNQIEAGGNKEEVKSSISKAIETKSKWTCRYKYVLPTGEVRTHLGFGTPNFLADGTILFNSIALDITQEAKNEELLEQITKVARIGSWELDLVNQEGEEMYWSPMLYEILELDDDYNPTLTGGIEFHVGESQDRIKKALDLLINEGIEFDEEILVRTAKGNKRWNRAIGKSEIVNNKPTRIYGSYQDIHQKKVAGLTLENSLKALKDYKFSLDQSAIIATTDNKGVITSVNENFCKISKYKEKELVGKTHRLINSNHHPKEFFKNLWKTIGSGSVWRGELKNIAKDGSYYWVDTTIVPFMDESNKPFQYLAIRFDITERKKAEQEKNHLQVTIENSLNEIYIFDAKTLLFTYVNRGAYLNLGYSNAEMKTFTPIDIKPDYTPDAFNDLVAPLIHKEKEKILFFTNHLRKDGSTYPVEVHLQMFDEGENKRFLAIILDITERKKAEEDNRFKANLLSTVGQAAIATDLDGIVKYWNKAAETIYGWKTEEAIGSDIMRLTPTDTNKKEAEQIMEVLKKGQTWQGEFQVQKKDGIIFPVRITNSPIYDEDNLLSGIIGISTDITEEVENKELLKQYTHELERSNEELEQFAFIASHDLQEPLRMISSFMDQLKRKYGNELDDKAHQYIHYATDGAKRMKEIILDLLDYSRAKKPTEGKENVVLTEVVSEFKLLRKKVISEKSAQITSSHLPTLYTYKAVVVQILHCLLDNAIKYSKADTPPIIEIKAVEKEKEWKFSIKDNGIGIDPKFYDKIFVIFQRLHNRDQYDGTGIGLSI